MALMQSWKDSLSLFRWSNFKPFLLVTFKSIKDYSFLLLSVFILFNVIPGLLLTVELRTILFAVSVVLYCLILRPSVDKKASFAYFNRFLTLENIVSVFLINLTIFLFFIVLTSSLDIMDSIFNLSHINIVFLYLPSFFSRLIGLFIEFFGYSFWWASYYFLFDASTQERFKFFYALTRGVTFAWYNFPIVIIGLLIFSVAQLGIMYLVMLGFYIDPLFKIKILRLSFNMLGVIMAAFIGTLYTKRVYEQYELYFAHYKKNE